MHTISWRMPPRAGTEVRRHIPIAVGRRAWQALFQGLETLIVWQERANQRRALADLDARALKDIGLSRADVVRESGKPFWRA